MKLAPSILSADFAELGAEVERVREVADLLHVDVMDGHFVPNLTIGPPVVKSLRKRTDLFLDCHLMVDNPGVLLDEFADAGADRCIVHVELGDPRPLFDELRARDVGVGLVLNPPTAGRRGAAVPRPDRPAAGDERQPGLGRPGRSSPRCSTRSRSRARRSTPAAWPVEIEIDGGINVDTAGAAAAAGCDILVAGSAVFRAPDPAAAGRAILAAAGRGTRAREPGPRGAVSTWWPRCWSSPTACTRARARTTPAPRSCSG